MEKLNQNAAALSFGIITAIVYVACIIFVAIVPLETVIAVGNLFVHGIDISSIATKNITVARSVIGFIAVFLSSAVIGYVFAYLYNWIGEKV